MNPTVVNANASLQNTLTPATQIDVAIITEQRYLHANTDEAYICQLHYEEALILRSLRARGLRVQRLAWDDPAVDWTRARVALFRSPWNYFDVYAQFSRWLAQVKQQTQLINSARIIDWNIDKHYLADLQAAGVATVPTLFVERGQQCSLLATLRAQGWTQAVFKPAVSGAARLTHRFDANSAASLQSLFDAACSDEAMMLQPFLARVQDEGELSLIVIDGHYSHAVRKVPKAGDFRVQDDHGGTVLPHLASSDDIAFAEAAIAACPERPLYARVDVVRDEAGALNIMELELFEPELFLRFDTRAAERIADAVRKALAALPAM